MEKINRVGAEIAASIEAVGMYAIEVADGELVPIISLAPGKIGEIQVKYQANFNDIVFHPMTRMDVLEAVVLACFDKSKKKKPKMQFRDARDLLPYLVEIPSTLPVPDLEDLVDDEAGEADPTSASSTPS